MGWLQNIAPYTSVLQGQQQGQNASDYYRRQAQQQQMQDQLQRALLMGKLREMNDQQAAMQAAPKDEQQYLNLGGTVGGYQKRQDMTSQANSLADQMYQDAMDANKSPQERMDLFQRSANLRAHPELAELPENQKYGSGTTKTPKQWEFVDKDTGAPIIYSGGPIPPNAVPASVYANMHKTPPQTASQKMGETPVGQLKGLNVVGPDGLPWANPTDTYNEAIAKGGVSISDQNQKILAMNETANDDLDNLLAAGEQVLPKTSGGMSSLLNPLKLGAESAVGSPNVGAYNASKIALITHLRAVANAARVNQQELMQVNGALANANSYPALKAAVEQARDLLAKSRKYLVKAGSLGGGASPTPDKSIGWAPDGREVFQRPDGSKYAQ